MELKLIGTPEEIADALRRLSAPVSAPKTKTKKRKVREAKPYVNETGSGLTFTIDPTYIPNVNDPVIIPSMWHPPDQWVSPDSTGTRPWTFTLDNMNSNRTSPYEIESTSQPLR